MEKSFDDFHKTAIMLLEAMAIGLGLPQHYFEPLHANHSHEFRLAHYPEIKLEELLGGSKTRTGEHTDWGTITLLFQDGVGGLEAEDQKNEGRFYPIAAEKPFMIVNVGDSFPRWTNGRLKSARHRVTVPSSFENHRASVPERYSTAFFCKPTRHVSLSPFPDLLGGAASNYKDEIVAGEYNRRKQIKVY